MGANNTRPTNAPSRSDTIQLQRRVTVLPNSLHLCYLELGDRRVYGTVVDELSTDKELTFLWNLTLPDKVDTPTSSMSLSDYTSEQLDELRDNREINSLDLSGISCNEAMDPNFKIHALSLDTITEDDYNFMSKRDVKSLTLKVCKVNSYVATTKLQIPRISCHLSNLLDLYSFLDFRAIEEYKEVDNQYLNQSKSPIHLLERLRRLKLIHQRTINYFPSSVLQSIVTLELPVDNEELFKRQISQFKELRQLTITRGTLDASIVPTTVKKLRVPLSNSITGDRLKLYSRLKLLEYEDSSEVLTPLPKTKLRVVTEVEGKRVTIVLITKSQT